MAWRLPFGGGASTRATPVVENGVPSIGAGMRLHAIDVVTGAIRRTIVTFVNSGQPTHNIVAVDGEWRTGTLKMPSPHVYFFVQPGTHTNHCEDPPWAMG